VVLADRMNFYGIVLFLSHAQMYLNVEELVK